MKDKSNGRACIWLMVNHEGQRTLFRLVEEGSGDDVLRVGSELHAPTIVVDIALPALPALNETPARRRRSANSRLILLNLRTVAGDDAKGVLVRRIQ